MPGAHQEGKATMTNRRGFRDGGIDARGENSWRIRYRVNGRRFTKTVKRHEIGSTEGAKGFASCR
jgi:hypothetical protein